MTVKAVLFDLFDTLLLIKKNHDFYSPSLMRMYKFLNGNGVDVPLERFQEAHAKARDLLYAKADPNLEEPHFKVRLALTLKLLGYNHDASSRLVTSASAEWCEEFMKYVYPDQDAEPLLRSLHGKYKLGIVSNYAIPECVDKLLQKYGFDALFDAVVVSGAVNKRKPSPEIFARTLDAMGVSAAETVFVGDTLDADIEGAKAAGMKAVYIMRREEKPVENAVPDFVITRLTEVPALLQKV